MQPEQDLAASVPFLDLARVHEPLREKLVTEFAELIESSQFVNGPRVEEFEREYASYCGTANCVGTASGLDALRLALIAMGISAGDEVIVPAMTFVATFEAVTQAGATPVPVDVTEEDFGLDPGAAASAVGDRTRALLPVHLYGQLADVKGLRAVASRYDLPLLEDACQAHGAKRDDLRAGACGTAAAFSFYPGKNLGAMGDAGALVTDDAELASSVRSLREHGQRRKYEHEQIGWTARLDAMQAIVLLAKLRHLDEWNAARRLVADAYAVELDGVGDLRLPEVAPDSGPVWHLYVVRTADPDRLGGFLAEHGVATGRHYPQPPHLTAAYEHLGYAPGAFPVAEALADECLSLPIFPAMTDDEISRVVSGVRAWFARG